MLQTGSRAELDRFLDHDLVAQASGEDGYFNELSSPLSRSLVVYGAGNLGRRTIAGLRKLGIVPLACADGDVKLHDTYVDGIIVLAPEDAARRFGAVAVFVIAVWSAGDDRRVATIRGGLEELGCRKVLSFAPLFRQHPEVFLPHYRIDTRRNALAAADDIRQAFTLLADEASRREYLDQLVWMLSDDFGELPQRWFHETYFPPEFIAPDSNEVFVDCGAFDGDTIKAFLKVRGGRFGRIVAVEPDPENYNKLKTYVSSLSDGIRRRIDLEMLAVGAARTTLRFEAMGNVSSRFSATGACTVQCVPMREVIPDADPTYIKMDIEGAEVSALTGAAEMIRRNPPVLAVCVYHTQQDLWRIPLLIHSLYGDYRLYLRRYGDEFGDVVCYAVPPHRLCGDRVGE